MPVSIKHSLLLCLAALLLVRCSVTEETIELWKGTQNGPKKLAGTIIDPGVELNLRAKAAVALVQINNWDLFRESFTKMDKADGDQVIAAIAPILGEVSKGDGGSEEVGPTKNQIDAKDGLFKMLDFAGPKSKPIVVDLLVAWCTEGNFNRRFLAGEHTIANLAKKMGPPAALKLANLLTIDHIAGKEIAKLIREIGDEEALVKASGKFAAELLANVGKITEDNLLAAASIGGDPLADALMALATDANLSDELQRFSLRAYSLSMEQGYMTSNKKRTDQLFEMAENTKYDQFQREETYLTIAQAAAPGDAPRVAKLLTDDSFFWRQVGLRCLLRIDGENQLEGALATKGLTTSGEEIGEVIGWVAKFPKLLPTVRKLLDSEDTFVKAVAIYVVGAVGATAKDGPALEKLTSDKSKLPKGFDHKTIGEAAAFSLETLKQKG